MERLPMSYTDQAASEGAVEYPSSALMAPENMLLPYGYKSFIPSELFNHICLAGGGNNQLLLVPSSSSSLVLDSEANSSAAAAAFAATYGPADDNLIQESEEMEVLVMIKFKILHHQLFPRMLRAYLDCTKFIAGGMLETDEMESWNNDDISAVLGSDPELDEFMETYCEILEKHNEDMYNRFYGVTTFINSMEMQLANLCGALSITPFPGEDAEKEITPPPEEEQPFSTELPATQTLNYTKAKSDLDLKINLLSKYGCDQLNNLKVEFSKRTKKKKGKLPCHAQQILVNWWNSHHNWPYPSEADKVELTRMTGLVTMQINNWFINQRKRHWKTPTESLQYSWIDNNLSAGTVLDFANEGFDAN